MLPLRSLDQLAVEIGASWLKHGLNSIMSVCEMCRVFVCAHSVSSWCRADINVCVFLKLKLDVFDDVARLYNVVTTESVKYLCRASRL